MVCTLQKRSKRKRNETNIQKTKKKEKSKSAKRKKEKERKNLSKIKKISLISILILAITLAVSMVPQAVSMVPQAVSMVPQAVSMVPKAYSTGGTGISFIIICPGPGPHRNDLIGPGPQGFLMNPASPPLPVLSPGPQVAPPYPYKGWVIPPAAPQPIAKWSNEGGPLVYFGTPDFDYYVPFIVWDAAGGKGYFLRSVSWTPGVSLGVEGSGPNFLWYFWDTDGDTALETYIRFYARDPGEVTFFYGSAVGGVWVPVDKFGLLAPYIGFASTIIVATVATSIYAKRVKRREEKQ